MKGLQALRSIWNNQVRLRPHLEDQATCHSAVRKLLKDKKNICGVENIDTQELNQADYVLD